MDTRGTVTVIWAVALIVPTDAVIVVVPRLNEFTIPALPAASLTHATAGFDEFQMTDCKGPRLSPYASYAVALRARVSPRLNGLFDGEMTIDATCAGARLVGWYESVLDSVTPLLMPPTKSTAPSVKSVAVWPERPVERLWLVVKLPAYGLNISVVLSEVHVVAHAL
jgi:hypothetical protein